MKPFPVICALSVLLTGLPVQAQVLAQAGVDPAVAEQKKVQASSAALKQGQEQLARDEKALADARKSGDAKKIKAAEDKVRVSRSKVDAERKQFAADRKRVQDRERESRTEREGGKRGDRD